MASADVDGRPRDRGSRRKPFANLVKRLTSFKNHGDSHNPKKSSNGNVSKQKKGNRGNNPYPESGVQYTPQTQHTRQASQPSFSASSRPHTERLSNGSIPASNFQDNEYPSQGNRSAAPTLATNPETVSSDAGQSKAATTTTTGGRAVSSIDGVGAGSTFSSPNHSERSLTTTLTTIQSQGHAMQAASHGHSHNQESQPNGTMYNPPFPGTASAIPRHLQGDTNTPNTYSSATANNLFTDNASILTLASSSKQRRRSMDTDASVRALAPSSVWGGSRESLPLSVLSANIDRPPASGMPSASAERASIYSSSGIAGARESMGINSPALASERNSYYAGKTPADAKSLRSITMNLRDETRSIGNREHDVASIRSLAPSEARIAPGGGGHSRADSIGTSPLASPALPRQSSTTGQASSLRRSSADWRAIDPEENTANQAGFFDGKK